MNWFPHSICERTVVWLDIKELFVIFMLKENHKPALGPISD